MKLPQLTLRDLFWLVLVAACLCGWFRESQKQERQSAAFLEHWIEKHHHGAVRYPGRYTVEVTDTRTGRTETFNMNRPTSQAPPALAVLAIVSIPLGLYALLRACRRANAYPLPAVRA